MNLYYVAKRTPLNQSDGPDQYIILGQNDSNFLTINKSARNPRELAEKFHSFIDKIREKQVAEVNNHFLTYRPPKEVEIYSANLKTEQRAVHFRLEQLTRQERNEFESTLADLSK